jgi:hypothetical protein
MPEAFMLYFRQRVSGVSTAGRKGVSAQPRSPRTAIVPGQARRVVLHTLAGAGSVMRVRVFLSGMYDPALRPASAHDAPEEHGPAIA